MHKVLGRPITYQNIKKQDFCFLEPSDQTGSTKVSMQSDTVLGVCDPGLGWGSRGGPWCLSGRGGTEPLVMVTVAGVEGH